MGAKCSRKATRGPSKSTPRRTDTNHNLCGEATEPGRSCDINDVSSERWRKYVYPFEYLALSGGGAKGCAYMGAMQALDEAGILEHIQGYAGCSIGAVVAGLVAVGYSPSELQTALGKRFAKKFKDQKCMPFFAIPNLMKKLGIHSGKRFLEEYGRLLARKTHNPDITFSEIKRKYRVKLRVAVTNVTAMTAEYCDYDTTPDMPVRLAVRMSISMPGVYRPVQYMLNDIPSWYTDGALLNVFPINAFTEECESSSQHLRSSVTSHDGPDPRANHTLGLYLYADMPHEHRSWRALFKTQLPCKPTFIPKTRLARNLVNKVDKQSSSSWLKKRRQRSYWKRKSFENNNSGIEYPDTEVPSSHEISSFGGVWQATTSTVMFNSWKQHVKPQDFHRTIPINCGYIKTTDFDVEEGDMEFLVTQGYECTKRYLSDFSRWSPKESS